MTANRNLLRMKFARVVEALAVELKCPLDEALKRFYSSMTYRLMRDGVSDMAVQGLDLPNASASAREFCQARRNSINP